MAKKAWAAADPAIAALIQRELQRQQSHLELIASDYGQPCEQGLRLQVKLTHQELASTLSTTRVTVTRILGALRDEGWLHIDSQRRLVVSHLPQQRNQHR